MRTTALTLSLLLLTAPATLRANSTSRLSSEQTYTLHTIIIKAPVGPITFESESTKFSLTSLPASSHSIKTRYSRIAAIVASAIEQGKSECEILEELRKNTTSDKGTSVTITLENTKNGEAERKNNASEPKKNEILKIISSYLANRGGTSKDAANATAELVKRLKAIESETSDVDSEAHPRIVEWERQIPTSATELSIDPDSGAVSLALAAGELTINGVRLSVEKGSLRWDGSPEPPRGSRLRVARCPVMRLKPGLEKTQLMIAKTDFMRTRKKNVYALETLPPEKSPGVILAASATPLKKDMVKLHLEITVNVLAGRKKLPGTSLDIGEPVILTKKLKQDACRKLGDWMLTCGYFVKDKRTGKTTQLLLLQKLEKERN